MQEVLSLTQKHVMPNDLQGFCAAAMRKCGLTPPDAALSAEIFATTDAWGIHSHGTRQIRGLMRNVRDGRIDPGATPVIISEGPAWAVVGGRRAMPTVIAWWSMKQAMRKAKEAGIGYVGVRESNHFGAAGCYAAMALQNDMIGMAMTNTDPWMTVPGGRGPVLGTNPIAFAIPAGEERPILLDIATSVTAVTKVLIAKALGRAVPQGWLVDQEGLPTTDPSQYPEKSSLLPMAPLHKGYGLALLVEALTAALSGAAMMSQVGFWLSDMPIPPNQGHAFLAIDVPAMTPIRTFKERIDWMIREIKNAPLAQGADRIWLPGEMEWEHQEAALRDGMQLPDYVIVNLLGLAEDVDMLPELKAIFR
ncbi:MAG: Ldh family oxidoreductase [candidate division NC10 bacterium]|nr:Ldh family oxidoreductase [candidate division NC10 bacterium]